MTAQARLGNLPRGAFTSDSYTIDSARAAKRNCDDNLHCAAISYRRIADADGDDGLTFFHTHSFVPELLDADETRDDADGDEFGGTAVAGQFCDDGAGRSANDDDCNDDDDDDDLELSCCL